MTDNTVDFHFDETRLNAFQRGDFAMHTLMPVLKAWQASVPNADRELREIVGSFAGGELTQAEAEMMVASIGQYRNVFDLFLELQAGLAIELQATADKQARFYLSVLEMKKESEAIMAQAVAMVNGGAQHGGL